MYIKYCVRECVHIYILYITHTHMGSGMSLRAWVGSWNAPARHQRPGHSRQDVGPDLPPCWHSSQPVIKIAIRIQAEKTSWSTAALLKSSEQMILWTTAGRTRAVTGNFRGPCARKNPHATLKWRTVMIHTLVKWLPVLTVLVVQLGGIFVAWQTSLYFIILLL